jgi:hypothetical protein
MAMDCAIFCRYDCGHMDQSVFKTLVIAFAVIMRMINSEISRMIPGRPGPRLWLKFHFCDTNCRCHRNSISGHTIVSSFIKALRPTAFAFRPRSARSASVNRMRFPHSRSFRSWFSACRNSMTIS